ncbi:hypothetical protein SLEP1_g48302 [Rubroshorea leprosula]|uniref:Uncharacterized protein n=1 Tax=Rubroshorea leprosula TaxID=152421 RepID=A0AAV5LVI5_9ROSI|nr:hypothetical protein SLEP1_g48302 [Rubroshorea leprosula]
MAATAFIRSSHGLQLMTGHKTCSQTKAYLRSPYLTAPPVLPQKSQVALRARPRCLSSRSWQQSIIWSHFENNQGASHHMPSGAHVNADELAGNGVMYMAALCTSSSVVNHFSLPP